MKWLFSMGTMVHPSRHPLPRCKTVLRDRSRRVIAGGRVIAAQSAASQFIASQFIAS
jgi:hypothetical protein